MIPENGYGRNRQENARNTEIHLNLLFIKNSLVAGVKAK
jgi:hypothetical protein